MSSGQFAFSFDHETFVGNFATRNGALAAAERALLDRADQPSGIFIGQWVQPDPQTDGHAEALLTALHDRWQQTGVDAAALAGVSDQQAAGLDEEVGRVLTVWLSRHGLVPPAVRVQGVSHHPVPNVHHVDSPTVERETSLIGEA